MPDHEKIDPEVEEEIEAPVEWEPYLYKDFSVHFRDVMNRRMEDTSGGDEGAFFRNIIRLKQYFDEFYEEPHSIRNHGSFVLALHHLSHYAEEYDVDLLAIAHKKELYVSEGLLRAVHWYFAEQPRSEMGSDEDAIPKIKAWAARWAAENPTGEQDEDGNPDHASS